ncbi:MAG TPA: sulfite exporter TauE/SafE family protein [Symbiobacteriaceae bacterium]|nr:sulfite exporter TauE/SafE family protein [Symbiobacteriaceae bacterium]
MIDLLMAAVFALGAGTIIGLFGAGGSITMVPILTYGLKIPLKIAIGMTLIIEAFTGFIASWFYRRNGQTQIRAAIPYALAGAAGSFTGGYLTKYIPTGVLLTIFGVTVLGAAAMLTRNVIRGKVQGTGKMANVWLFATVGLFVGFLTGMIGVGGGFLIVPALVLLGGLDIKMAVGTSLFVIGLQSTAGVSGILLSGTRFDLTPTAIITIANVAGSLFGKYLSSRLPVQKVQVGFIGLLLVLGSVTIAKAVV